MAGLDREQRRARVEELERYIEEQNAAFADEPFTDEVRAAFDQADEELKEHRRVLAELEQRDARVRAASQRGGGEPGGTDPGTTRGGGGPPGPVMISRMSEAQVYDLDAIRANPFQPERSNDELRSRALRAVELATFPHTNAKKGWTRERSQEHVEHLIRRSDDDFQGLQIAQRILLTGSPAYRRAFTKNLRAQLNKTFPSLTPEEQRAMERVEEMQRAMSVGTGSAGGFAVPYTLDPTVIPTSNLSVNPYRAICRVEQITVLQWLGVTSAGVTAAYATEATEASDNAPTLAQPSMNMIRAQCFVPVSIELTQDWGALQGELADLIQDAKDDLEANKFAVGSGTNEPTGMVTGATTTVTSANVAGFVVADLYATEQALGPRFRPRAQWIGNRFTYNKARQFDTAGGANLLVYLPAGLANDVPRGGNMGQQMIGYPMNEASGMVAALTTGSKILALGDPRYFIIVDRIGLDIEVIPHLFGATSRFPTGQRGFYAFWRNNARVLDPNAFRILVTQ